MATRPTPVQGAAREGLSRVATFYRILRANPLSLVGFLLVGALVLLAVAVTVVPGLVVPYRPTQFSGVYNAPPSSAHWFGTDGNGFDIYSNVLYALPLDLAIGLLIAGAALIIGGGLGLVAGFWDRPGSASAVLSAAILRVTDIFLSFPSLILALAISVSLGRGAWQAVLAVTVTWWPYYVRLVRGEVLAVKHLPYIMAARAAGVTEGRIVLRHVLRNILDPILVYFTLDIGTILVTFSTIGFVAKSIPYPSSTPEWGSMMAYYQQGLVSAYPWTILAPGAMIFLTVLAFSLLGDGLRDVLDPRSRRALVRSASKEPPKEQPAPASAGPGAAAAAARAETAIGGGTP